jgi:hypothetical protein
MGGRGAQRAVPPLVSLRHRDDVLGMPSVTVADRLARAPVLDPAHVLLSPHEAAQRPVREATVQSVTEPDQWIVGNQLRNLRPWWKYSYPDGDAVYIGESGEVLVYAITISRLQAYVSAIPHWLCFTPLRANQPFWIRFATYTAMVGTAGAVIGVVLGVWLYSPRTARGCKLIEEFLRPPKTSWKELLLCVSTLLYSF